MRAEVRHHVAGGLAEIDRGDLGDDFGREILEQGREARLLALAEKRLDLVGEGGVLGAEGGEGEVLRGEEGARGGLGHGGHFRWGLVISSTKNVAAPRLLRRERSRIDN